MGRVWQGRGGGEGLAFAVAVARFNEDITRRLLDGALSALSEHGVPPEAVDVVWVPGSLELPVIARELGKSGRYHAIIALGCVIRHETMHFDLVAQGATMGLVQASLETGVPVLHGVLACYTREQALDRAGGARGNKGYEVAVNALEMAHLMRQLRDGLA
ncbi:MAG TPA: 6,7-dimethyl-8-ribityllumazine synthase [Dehalococcoidia bacterium]|nr:6,7-dimethyl-8-ribityllumazine synthase [Dehalococcoidia bacterium]